jgi:hypothetical protein
MPPRITVPIADRLEQLSIPVTECGCHIWTAGTYKAGYGCLMIDRKSFYAHRIAWEVNFGAIPLGLCVLHHCDIPACINPDHLFLGTKADNVADMDSKGRRRSAPQKKLNENDVLAIRSMAGTHRAIAKQFGVNHSTITRIKSGQTRHL